MENKVYRLIISKIPFPSYKPFYFIMCSYIYRGMYEGILTTDTPINDTSLRRTLKRYTPPDHTFLLIPGDFQVYLIPETLLHILTWKCREIIIM